MIRKQRLRTTGRHFERANKGETGERKKEKGRGWGRGKRREEGGGSGLPTPHPTPSPTPFPSLFSSPQFLPCSRVQNGGWSFVIAVFESFPPQNRLLCRLVSFDFLISLFTVSNIYYAFNQGRNRLWFAESKLQGSS